MSNIAAHFDELGLADTASRAEVRAAYKCLALQHHPDKVDEEDQEEAAAGFVKIQEAYEGCLKYLMAATVEEETEDDTDWRGKLPYGIFGFNTTWWNELTGDEPEPVMRWAAVCAKSQGNGGAKMTKTERWILNTEYYAAYEDFENWRHIHIEKHDQEDRLQAEINKMNSRAREQARANLGAKQSAPGYEFDPGYYEEEHDERRGKFSGEKRHASFKAQVAVLEQRDSTLDSRYQSKAEKKRKAKTRRETEARIMQEIEREEMTKFGANIKKKLTQTSKGGRSLTYVSGVRNPALLEPMDALDCWEDDLEGWTV